MYELFTTVWMLVLVGLFVAIVVWVFWPKRKNKLEEHGRIPLRDDEEK